MVLPIVLASFALVTYFLTKPKIKKDDLPRKMPTEAEKTREKLRKIKEFKDEDEEIKNSPEQKFF